MDKIISYLDERQGLTIENGSSLSQLRKLGGLAEYIQSSQQHQGCKQYWQYRLPYARHIPNHPACTFKVYEYSANYILSNCCIQNIFLITVTILTCWSIGIGQLFWVLGKHTISLSIQAGPIKIQSPLGCCCWRW